MKAKIIRIGNSQGVRLPRTLLKQVALGEEVILEASRGAIIMRPALAPRAGWGTAFEAMARLKDDKLLDTEASTSSWDEEEWEWR